MTPRGRVLSAAVICTAFLIGCQEQGSNPVGPEDLGPQFGHKPNHNPGGGGGGQEEDTIELNVTFRDDSDDGVKSDGGGLYEHGVDQVSAHLRDDPRWDWVFRLFTSTSRNEQPIRELCFNFGSAVDGLTSFPAGVGCDSANVFTGVPFDASGDSVPGGMLGIPTGITMRSTIAFEIDGFDWVLRYGFDCDLNNFSFDDPSRLTVTRVTDDQWTIEASGAAILCKTPLEKTKGKRVTTTVGSFPMPFLLTAVRQ